MRFVAGRGVVAKRLVRCAAVAERHRENAGRGAVAKRHRENAGRGRRGEETGSAVADSHQEDAGRRELRQEAASGSHTAAKGRWLGSSSGV